MLSAEEYFHAYKYDIMEGIKVYLEGQILSHNKTISLTPFHLRKELKENVNNLYERIREADETKYSDVVPGYFAASFDVIKRGKEIVHKSNTEDSELDYLIFDGEQTLLRLLKSFEELGDLGFRHRDRMNNEDVLSFSQDVDFLYSENSKFMRAIQDRFF